jgi:SAM-dependent methyltransferase
MSSSRTLNLTELDDRIGVFDYIICHGVYSWVPAPVRDRIMEICARNLAPNGVAYISYNIYPGWHFRGMVREMMRYHTQGITDPIAQVQQARALTDLIMRSATPQDGPYASYLREENKKLEKFRDTYLFHEYLEEENHPVYFHEFVAHAATAGLRYLSQAVFAFEEFTLSPDFRQTISRLGSDVIRREQYVDFVLNRAFRQTLLCHTGLTTYEGPMPEAVRSLRLVAMARPENPSPDLLSDAREPFITSYGNTLIIDEPLIKAALMVLYRLWPQSTGFEELWAATLDLLGRSETASEADRGELAAKLLECHRYQLVNFQTFEPPIASEPGGRPRATALTRRTAAGGARIISLRNHIATIEEIDRLVLPLLDGSRDEAAVIEGLASAVAAGKLNLKSDGEPIVEPAAVRWALVPTVRSSLQRIADQALLIGEA